MEMVSDVIFQTLGPISVILGLFRPFLVTWSLLANFAQISRISKKVTDKNVPYETISIRFLLVSRLC